MTNITIIWPSSSLHDDIIIITLPNIIIITLPNIIIISWPTSSSLHDYSTIAWPTSWLHDQHHHDCMTNIIIAWPTSSLYDQHHHYMINIIIAWPTSLFYGQHRHHIIIITITSPSSLLHAQYLITRSTTSPLWDQQSHDRHLNRWPVFHYNTNHCRVHIHRDWQIRTHPAPLQSTCTTSTHPYPIPHNERMWLGAFAT